LAHIFGQGDEPRKQDYAYQRPVAYAAGLLQFEVAVPGKGHESVGDDKQADSV
jgi:hypothetical protein